MHANPKLTTFLYSNGQDLSTQQKKISTVKVNKTLSGKSAVVSTTVTQNISRQQWISDAAYYKAEAREFKGGNELHDWLEAEKDYAKMQVIAYLSVCEEDGGITNANLRQLAKMIGVEAPEAISQKTELVRAIQKACHHRPCFRSGTGAPCQDKECKWETECQKLVAEWMR